MKKEYKGFIYAIIWAIVVVELISIANYFKPDVPFYLEGLWVVMGGIMMYMIYSITSGKLKNAIG